MKRTGRYDKTTKKTSRPVRGAWIETIECSAPDDIFAVAPRAGRVD